jgi:hypothetical protein
MMRPPLGPWGLVLGLNFLRSSAAVSLWPMKMKTHFSFTTFSPQKNIIIRVRKWENEQASASRVSLSVYLYTRINILSWRTSSLELLMKTDTECLLSILIPTLSFMYV